MTHDELQPNEDLYYSTGDKILALSDRLAEDIVLENIEEQLSDELNPLETKINYVSLFREKYEALTPDDECYDDSYIKDSLARVATCIGNGIYERYGVELGEDLDYTLPIDYLKDMETLYEFLFIRHYENLVDYFKHELSVNKAAFIERYTPLMEDEEHSKDIFVLQSKKKFKNKEDILILHFMNEILHDIESQTTSAYDLFKEITELDIYEEYNNRMSELLLNYGNKIVLNNDALSAELYLKPLKDSNVFSELRNQIVIAYLEGCEIND